MVSREQKIKELMESLQSLRRTFAFRGGGISRLRITPSQWGVLMTIGREGERTVKDIAKALGITSSAATQLIDGLVESGYVVRKVHPEDRRSITLVFSQKAKKQVEKMKAEGNRRFLKLFEVLNDKEFDQYIRLNKKIVERSLKAAPKK